MSDLSLPKTQKASRVIAEEHGFQTRKGIEIPYMTHLYEVMKRVLRYGVTDDDVLAAALLHDIIEDTPCGCLWLKEEFGDRVANIVVECSRNEEDGYTREGKLKFLESFETKSWESIIIKIADRRCNVNDYLADGKVYYGCWYALQAYPLYRSAFRFENENDDVFNRIVLEMQDINHQMIHYVPEYSKVAFYKPDFSNDEKAYELIRKGPLKKD